MHFPRRLANRPEHAEVAYRSPDGLGVFLEDRNLATTSGKVVSMSQAQDAGTDHDVIESGTHDGLAWAASISATCTVASSAGR